MSIDTDEEESYRDAVPRMVREDTESSSQHETAYSREKSEIPTLQRNAWMGSLVFLILILAVPIASADWTSVGNKHGCEIYKGETEDDIAPIRAVCDWPISTNSVIQTLDHPGDLETVFSTVEQSAVLESELNGAELVYQSYRKTIFFRREVVLTMSSEFIPDGRRFSWKKASDQSALTGDRIEIDRTENLWEVTGTEDRCHIVLELSFAPGGSVPAFLIGWLQGAGVKEQLGELRSYAGSHGDDLDNPNRTY